MELRHLHYFIAVAEELHFGRAATRLNVSQPPLSRQIRPFEGELGIRLLHRTKREVRLTEAGVRILNEAHHVLDAADYLKRLAGQASEGGIGRLSQLWLLFHSRKHRRELRDRRAVVTRL
ncbi:MAG: LysR family transcriptional regulator [Acidobacteria bacterium]|nr:LysR family transcriptional regulator [Acidobacteriota bacterium]